MENVAICLFFDVEVEARIRHLWKELADKGISSEMPDADWRPHITVSGCREVSIEEYASALQQFAERTASVNVVLSSVGYFSGNHHTLFLAPTITQVLLELHTEHDQLVRAYSQNLSPYYAPDQWVPHCTLALNLTTEGLQAAVEESAGFNLPITGRLEKIGIVQVARPLVREIASYYLRILA